jgi:hypothetical protein
VGDFVLGIVSWRRIKVVIIDDIAAFVPPGISVINGFVSRKPAYRYRRDCLLSTGNYAVYWFYADEDAAAALFDFLLCIAAIEICKETTLGLS